MHQRIIPRWKAKAGEVRSASENKCEEASTTSDETARAALLEEARELEAQAGWLDETIVQIIISEAQNEVADFKKWGFDIIPHRALMKQGFEMGDGKRVEVETAFKDPKHPFRVAIVCAMWLTGFDVECLSTMYIDKPMKAHTLMQAIARANRVYPGKDFGLIVDYNGMLKSLREALAQYALGDDGSGGEEIVAPIEERVQALLEGIEATEAHLRDLGFDPATLVGAQGFARIKGLADAVNAVYTTDEAKRRFEILARQVFSRFKALLMEPTAFAYAERHDNIEAIYKKLTERRDTADVTELLKELHRIVNQAILTQAPGEDQAKGLTFDLSQIDLDKLRDEFAKKVKREISGSTDLKMKLRTFFEEFLGRLLVQDFKLVLTTNHPYRFRNEIIQLAEDLLHRNDIIHDAAAGYVSAQLAATQESAETLVRQHLDQIRDAFDAIADSFQKINDFRIQLEGRLRNTIRYMERADEKSARRLAAIIQTIAKTETARAKAGLKPLEYRSQLMIQAPRLSAAEGEERRGSLALPAPRRHHHEEEFLAERVKDPALAELRRLERDWLAMTDPDISAVLKWLDRKIRPGESLDASMIRVGDLERLFLFLKMRSTISAGHREYEIERLDGRRDDPWLETSNFRITRAEKAS
jgi:hypothetical protein